MAPRTILCAGTHRRADGVAGELSERFAIGVLAGYQHVHTFDGHRQKLAIVDLFGGSADQTDQDFAAPGDGDDITRLDDSVGGRRRGLFRPA